MKCKVIRAFGNYSVGAIIDPPGVYRQHLQSRGLIEPLPKEESAPIVERAVEVVESSVAAASRRPRRASSSH